MSEQCYCHGLIVGRFYPYHLGHQQMISKGDNQCRRLTVVVTSRQQQSIPAETRAEWIREDFPEAKIIVFDQSKSGLPNRSATLWAAAIGQEVGEVDAVFSNEEYQREFAQLLEAQLVMTDCERKQLSISASDIRHDPEGNQQFLRPDIFQHIRHIDFTED